MLISVTLNGVISKQLTLFLTLIGVTPNSETQTPMTLPAPETFHVAFVAKCAQLKKRFALVGVPAQAIQKVVLLGKGIQTVTSGCGLLRVLNVYEFLMNALKGKVR